ncbi:hypothetical protein [Methanolacinia petrolearia]|uniref:hypothetical protein n=1 Tax=Methanolacinia petrolearia TaxID=54120 RepID=UPI00064E3086|nr:hypothetical protein [Methanolacinia petrolearia]
MKEKIRDNPEFKKFYGNEIYTEYKDLFTDTCPSYYRIESGNVLDFILKSKNPVIVFLKPNIYNEEQFIKYLGISVNHFFEIMKEEKPGIIPFCDKPGSYKIDSGSGKYNPFYAELFNEWFDNDLLSKRPPLYGNALESAFIRPAPKQNDLWIEYKEELENNFPNIYHAKVQPDKKLDKHEFGNYFAERLARLEMLDLMPIHEIIWNMLVQCNNSQKQQDLDVTARLMFYCHQIFSVSTFYSKGSVLTLSKNDYDNILYSLNRMAKELSDSSKFAPQMKNKIRRILPSLYGLSSRQIAGIEEKLPLCFPGDLGSEKQLELWQKMMKNDSLYDDRTDCMKYENEYTKSQSDYVQGFRELGNLNEKWEPFYEEMKNLRDSYMKYSLGPYKWVRSSCEVLSTLPLGNISGYIIDILSEQDIGSFFSPLVEAGPAFVNCLVQNKSFEKELNICTGSKLFQSFSVSVWQKG